MAPDVRPELIDDLVDSYVEWREECLFHEDAYHLWTAGSAEDHALAFAAYRAALDREQQASLIYAKRSDRVASELATGRGPLRRLWQPVAVPA